MTNHNTRRAALLRLLEDWEAGRMTPNEAFPITFNRISDEKPALIAWNINPLEWTLTPAGLAAARAEKEKGG